MHDLCLIHTDLKPENILLVSSDYVKLPGFKVFWLLPSTVHVCFIFRYRFIYTVIKLLENGTEVFFG